MLIEKNYSFQYRELEWADLNEADRILAQEAEKAIQGSHAQYSHFQVGCALRLGNGKIVKGANQENASFPCGTCAERSALMYAQSEWPEETITTVAIAAKEDGELPPKPITPCGLCRQALLETEVRQGKNIRLLMLSRRTIISVERIIDLLPFQFSADNI